MSQPLHRRDLLKGTIAAGWPLLAGTAAGTAALAAEMPRCVKRAFNLGMVTYNVAGNWDLATIIKNCKDVGIGAVEFRTTHKHGVEPTLSKDQRTEVRKQCADGGLVIWGLGSVCEFHSPDAAVVDRHIEDGKRFIELAHDLGARGVKVRPNGLPKEVSPEKTIEQIGKSLRTLGEAAAAMGVEIWCEVHGSDGAALPENMKKMMDIADHPAVGVTWNSNGTDVKNGSVKAAFEMLRPKIYSCHMNELISSYPYRELFSLLNQTGYDRYTLIEAQPLPSANMADTLRWLRYYKALWDELSRPA